MYFDFLGEMPLFLPKGRESMLNGQNEVNQSLPSWNVIYLIFSVNLLLQEIRVEKINWHHKEVNQLVQN